MAASNSNSNETGRSQRKSLRLIGILVLIGAVGSVVVWLKVVHGSESKMDEMATFVVKKGPLRINVLESGSIKAREQKIIYNEVQGRTTIVSIVAEGSNVKQGDLLVTLDVGTLTDSRIDQDIRVKNAQAAFVNATENRAIVENQAISDVNAAQLTLQFAKQDLQKYKEGDYPNQLESATSKITLARENLAKAKQTLEWSEKLYKEKYIAETELVGDRLTRSRSEVDVNIAVNEMDLLQKYTYERQITQLESDVRQATMALERVERKANASVVQAQADLEAKDLEYKRQQEKLAKIVDQLGKAKIYAPVDGMVIYATSAQAGGGGGRMRMDNRQPLQDGVDVTERQELIYLPTAASSKADVAIHESSLQKVHVGLPAVITVDALPGKQYFGTVARIAPLPDPQSMFMNPDLKVYNSDVYLDANDPSLRTGMSCKVEIVVEEYRDAVYVPVQAVLRVDGKPTAYVVTPDGKLDERKVEIGLDNNTFVRIVSGLSEGEVVSLAPPLKTSTVEFATGSTRSADANDEDQDASMSRRIGQQLDNSRRSGGGGVGAQQPGRAGRGGRGPGGMGPMGGMMPGFDPNATPEERKQAIDTLLQGMQQRVDSMPPEQQSQIRQNIQRLQEIQNMPPEAQGKAMQDYMQRMMQQFQNMGRGNRGGGPGMGQGPGRGPGFGGPEGGQ